MTMTLRVMIGGVVRLEEATTYDLIHAACPMIEPMVTTLLKEGPVAVLVDDADGVTHILGVWR